MRSGACEALEQSVEVGEFGVFDDDSAVAVAVLDDDLEAKSALEDFLDFADVGVYGGHGFGFYFVALGVDQVLDVALCLTNR